jgi:SPP1 family phage portal protein
MQIGRAEIFTYEREINESNILSVLQDAYAKHTANAAKIDYLINFEAGVQPLQREKKHRPDIDIQSVDNVAHEITKFNLGYIWGNPITIVQRGEKDSGNADETYAISLLNECYQAENIKSKTQQLAYFVEIGGVGYTYIDINADGDFEDGDSYFSVDVLDPRWAFVVRSGRRIDHKIMMGVSYSRGDDGVLRFTCFTDNQRFEIINLTKTVVDGEEKDADIWDFADGSRGYSYRNRLGMVPVVEWVRSHDRMGCFERFIDELNTLNLMISDFSNDVEQNTQSYWHGNDVEFPIDEKGNRVEPGSGDWILTRTTQDGRQPFVKPLSIVYDYPGMLNNIACRRAWILEKANVPATSDNTNGATGVAMDDAIGWTKAETAANAQQGIMEASKMEEIKVVLRAIKENPKVNSDNPMKNLRYIDVEPNVKRMKTYEMVTKSNAFATYVSHGIYGLHALTAINAFSDVNQVWEDSKDLIESYQKSIFEKNQESGNEAVGGMDEQKPNADRLMGDVSDQIGNSPTIDKR